MRAPVDAMSSSAVAAFDRRNSSPQWTAVGSAYSHCAGDLAQQAERVNQCQGPSFAKWRENAKAGAIHLERKLNAEEVCIFNLEC